VSKFLKSSKGAGRLDAKGYSQGNWTQRKLIIPILKIFISLCSTPQFHWHLSKYNALDLLNRIREQEDDYISDVAKEVCEKVIDHSHEGQITNALNLSAGAGGNLGTSNMGAGLSNYDASMTAEYDVASEIEKICTSQNFQEVKNSVIHMEKMLIQKKVKLEKYDNDSLKRLINFLERVLKMHQEYLAKYSSSQSPDQENQS